MYQRASMRSNSGVSLAARAVARSRLQGSPRGTAVWLVSCHNCCHGYYHGLVRSFGDPSRYPARGCARARDSVGNSVARRRHRNRTAATGGGVGTQGPFADRTAEVQSPRPAVIDGRARSPCPTTPDTTVMPTFTLDSNCMIAAVSSWHEHHTAAGEELERRLEGGETLVAPAPALVEAYAVLTRLPAPHRLSPTDAWTLVDANFIRKRRVIALQGRAYRSLLRRVASDDIAGGRTYDEVIAECARRGRATTLLTFNRRHFDPPPPGIDVVEPSAKG